MYAVISTLFYLSQNLDKFLLYAVLPHSEYGLAVFGMYQQAFHWMMRPVLGITTPVTAVMLPALSRVQNDRPAFERLAVGFYQLIAVVLIPCGLGTLLVAEDVMLTVGGPAWQDAGVLLRALSPVILVQGLVNISGSVFSASNQLRAFAVAAAWFLVIQFQGLLAGYWFGTRAHDDPMAWAQGMAWGYSVTTAFVLGAPYLWFCCRIHQIEWKRLMKACVQPLWASGVMAVAVWYLQRGMSADMPAAARLVAAISLGMVIYAWLMRRTLWNLLRQYGTT
jgi:PST family polysaccharide transporter